jgi:hypothetical protein
MHGTNGGSLSTVPVFDRLQYFYGQLLGARDFQAEQSYFREKLKLHNRCLHGYGVVCGLEVGVVPPPKECAPPAEDEGDSREDIRRRIEELREKITHIEDRSSPEYKELEAEIERLVEEYRSGRTEPSNPKPREERPPLLAVAPGMALDCHGNELVVRDPIRFDPWKLLEPSERRRLEGAGSSTLWVSLCFHEQPVDPTRPALTDPCGAAGACTFGKLRESVCVQVSLDEPDEDTRCDTCCAACDECCLLLARVTGFAKGRPLAEGSVDNSVRRELGTDTPAAIAGVSWSHGGVYDLNDASELLGGDEGGDEGLEIRFTRGLRREGFVDPVLQVYVTERGGGRSANVYELRGEFGDMTLESGLVTSVRWHQTSDETLQYEDLVTITLRAPMLLDRCCRPLQGLNVGGRVPLLPEYKHLRSGEPPDHCERPPFRAGPWTTHGEGNFESWFFVRGRDEKPRKES